MIFLIKPNASTAPWKRLCLFDLTGYNSIEHWYLELCEEKEEFQQLTSAGVGALPVNHGLTGRREGRHRGHSIAFHSGSHICFDSSPFAV
jgi:hypothetical protein